MSAEYNASKQLSLLGTLDILLGVSQSLLLESLLLLQGYVAVKGIPRLFIYTWRIP